MRKMPRNAAGGPGRAEDVPEGLPVARKTLRGARKIFRPERKALGKSLR